MNDFLLNYLRYVRLFRQIVACFTILPYNYNIFSVCDITSNDESLTGRRKASQILRGDACLCYFLERLHLLEHLKFYKKKHNQLIITYSRFVNY